MMALLPWHDPNPPRRRITKEDLVKLFLKRRRDTKTNGAAIKKIAEELNCSASNVYKRLRRLGLLGKKGHLTPGIQNAFKPLPEPTPLIGLDWSTVLLLAKAGFLQEDLTLKTVLDLFEIIEA